MRYVLAALMFVLAGFVNTLTDQPAPTDSLGKHGSGEILSAIATPAECDHMGGRYLGALICWDVDH